MDLRKPPFPRIIDISHLIRTLGTKVNLSMNLMILIEIFGVSGIGVLIVTGVSDLLGVVEAGFWEVLLDKKGGFLVECVEKIKKTNLFCKNHYK